MPDLGERSPKQAQQRRDLRAQAIEAWRLTTSAAIDTRIDHHLERASMLLPKLKQHSKNLPLLYLLLAHLTAAALLAYDWKGPHSIRLRDICEKRYTHAKPKMHLLSLVLKAYGLYDDSTAEAQRRSDKAVSRDYAALSFVLSQGKLPGKDFVVFLKEHGFDACSRGLKPRSSKKRQETGAIPLEPITCFLYGSQIKSAFALLL